MSLSLIAVSIAGDDTFSMQDLSCVYSRLSEAFHPILDKLINDEEIFVRGSVAEQGYGLDKRINDESGFVRACVARQGYGLDKLVDDEDSYVREAVAE